MVYLLKIVIFHGYVKQPEGMWYPIFTVVTYRLLIGTHPQVTRKIWGVGEQIGKKTKATCNLWISFEYFSILQQYLCDHHRDSINEDLTSNKKTKIELNMCCVGPKIRALTGILPGKIVINRKIFATWFLVEKHIYYGNFNNSHVGALWSEDKI